MNKPHPSTGFVHCENRLNKFPFTLSTSSSKPVCNLVDGLVRPPMHFNFANCFGEISSFCFG